MFSKILFVNLDRRPDRKENVYNELNKIGWKGDVERISGVDWKTIDFNNIDKNLITDNGLNSALNENGLYTVMTKGGIGCSLAYRNAWLSVLNSNNNGYTLILDDDIWFVDDFMTKLNYYLKEVPEYDILWLGYHNKTNKYVFDNYDIPDLLWGTFGYVINKKAAKQLLSIFPITKQIDSEMPKVFPSLKVYALKEENRIILSMPSATDTQFGTDIQIREGFTVDYNYNILFIILFLMLLLFLHMNIKNYL
jgi:GR25 family glycosyltransferase involved in LPS biosynthesis